MFFELGEIDKIEIGINTLTQIKQKFDKKCLTAYSSNPQKVQNSLMKTFKIVLDEAERTLSCIKDIQDQVQMGYFVPSQLNFEQLVYDSSQLPEWFQFVFKKQFQKQKRNLDLLCKKTYKVQSLPEAKHYLQKQVQSFKLLIQRFQVLNSYQKTSLNVTGQSEIIRSKCKVCKQKYHSFCSVISTKILTFLQQSVNKSMNFSSSMNSMGNTVTNSFNVKLQPEQFQRGYLTNKFRQTNQFQQVQPAYKTGGYFMRKANNSVDFQGRYMYNKTNNDFTRSSNNFNRMNNDFNQTGFDRTNSDLNRTGFNRTNNESNGINNQPNRYRNQYARYVPRHVNTSTYDFYK